MKKLWNLEFGYFLAAMAGGGVFKGIEKKIFLFEEK